MSRDRFSPYEFALVIALAFGWSVYGSIVSLVQGRTVGTAGTVDSFTNGHLYGVVLTELLILPALAAVLYARGWRLADFPFGIGKAATALGILIGIGAWVIDIALAEVMESLYPSMRAEMQLLRDYAPTTPPDLVAIYLLSVVNPVFEEIVICGYVIPTLAARFGPTVAVNVSVCIRVSYHLYQGIAMAPFHLAYGLIQAYAFLKFRNLWPVVVSHAFLDFFALAALA